MRYMELSAAMKVLLGVEFQESQVRSTNEQTNYQLIFSVLRFTVWAYTELV